MSNKGIGQLHNHMSVYQVTLFGSNKDKHLGYAQGNVQDIKKYYSTKTDVAPDEALAVTPITIDYISYDMAHEIENLIVRKQKLEKELKQIEEKLNGNV